MIVWQAAKLRGSMVWAASSIFGRCGRSRQGPLSDRQYDPGAVELTQELADALRYIQALVAVVPARVIPFFKMCLPCHTLCSDANFEPEFVQPPGLGSVFACPSAPTLDFAAQVPDATLDAFSERATQIAPLLKCWPFLWPPGSAGKSTSVCGQWGASGRRAI